jgi:hypothetical protein
MSESKPIAMWIRIAAGVGVLLCVVNAVGLAWTFWHDRAASGEPWSKWIGLAWPSFPLLLVVALPGRTSWRRTIPSRFSYLINVLNLLYWGGFFVLIFRYQRPFAYVLSALFAWLVVYLLWIAYVAPIKGKRERIARAKVRHGAFP